MKVESPEGPVDVPDDLRYNREHVWVKEREKDFILGWTAFAVLSAGDIAYVSLPKKGERVEAGTEMGSIETGKWVGRLLSPLSGEILEVNEEVQKNPEVINRSPYDEGWFLRVRVLNQEGSSGLMGPEEYTEVVRKGRAF